jgi:calmodulin
MATQKERMVLKLKEDSEKARREKERREFKEAQELESLKRVFKRLDKNGDLKIDVEDLLGELAFLQMPYTRKEAGMILWEVDDDNDTAVDWEEFRMTFHRTRDDKTGCEPRKLFHVIEFLMHDKNHNGVIDVDECLAIMYARYGKDAIDARVQEILKDDDDKNIHFAKYMQVQSIQANNAMRQTPSSVPAVRGLSYSRDTSTALHI